MMTRASQMPGHEARSSVLPLSLPPQQCKRGRSRFTQSDVTRAIRAAIAANLAIAAVRIAPDGTILIIPGTPATVTPWEANPWDA